MVRQKTLMVLCHHGQRSLQVMSDPLPEERQHRTDLGTKIKSDSVIIQVETDEGLVGLGASLGSPHAICAIVEYELAPALIGVSNSQCNHRTPPRRANRP